MLENDFAHDCPEKISEKLINPPKKIETRHWSINFALIPENKIVINFSIMKI